MLASNIIDHGINAIITTPWLPSNIIEGKI